MERCRLHNSVSLSPYACSTYEYSIRAISSCKLNQSGSTCGRLSSTLCSPTRLYFYCVALLCTASIRWVDHLLSATHPVHSTSAAAASTAAPTKPLETPRAKPLCLAEQCFSGAYMKYTWYGTRDILAGTSRFFVRRGQDGIEIQRDAVTT